MKKLLILTFILVIAGACRTNNTNAQQQNEISSFISKIEIGIKAKNYETLNSLYCKKQHNSAKQWGIFKQSETVISKNVLLTQEQSEAFSSVEHQYLLKICFETVKTKERCQILPVVVDPTQICINNL